jgi:monovalent cation/hydrogen antiporter
MHSVSTVLLLLAAVTAMAVAARRINVPYPTVMVVGGLLIGLFPALPSVHLDPEIFFTLFLPPLLYAAAWQTSWREFRANLRPITLLATGFVIVTTCAIAWLGHAFVPGMTWPAAFALGAVVSPPDAVAATAIARPLGLPERIVTILEGESLVNDAAALTLYRVAVAAAVTGAFSLSWAVAQGLVAVAGGIAMGLLLGWLVVQIHKRLDDPLVETVITLLCSYAAFIPTEAIHCSGVLAVVTMGLFVSRRSNWIFSPATRLQAMSVWQITIFMLNGLVFVLVGLELPDVIATIHASGERTPQLILWAAELCVALVLVRMAWVFPAAYFPQLISRKLRERDPMPSWKAIFFIAYAGMRGADSLAAALAIPLTVASGALFPRRSLIIFLTFTSILATLVLQSLSLAPLIRWLNFEPEGEKGQCEEWEARLRAARAALKRIEDLEAKAKNGADHDGPTLQRLRTQYEQRIQRMSTAVEEEKSGRCAPVAEMEWSTYRLVLSAERDAVADLRDTDVIGDSVMHQIEWDLDLEESRIIAAEARTAV